MHTPKKKKSIDGYYPRSQYEDDLPLLFDSNGYTGLTQTSCDETTYYNQVDKRVHVNNNLINLNVGGIKYTTTLSTLANDKNSTLCKYAYRTLTGIEDPSGEDDFTGFFNFTDANSGGVANIFIDRDGKTFQFVLNYLRDGDLICPEDEFVYKSILSDAKFYRLNGLVELLNAKLDMDADVRLTPVKVKVPKEVEPFSQSQNTQLEFTDSIPLTQVTNCDMFMPAHNVFLRIEENDNIEESMHFVQTTPVRALGEEKFCTTADF